MRLSELLGRRVIDGSGRDLGRVHDVRLRGPGVGSIDTALGGPAFRIDGLVIRTGGLADRLGFDRAGVRTPALVRVVVLALLRQPAYVSWSRVTQLAQGRVEITGTGNDLEPPTVLTMGRS